jgi:hypothetical protein
MQLPQMIFVSGKWQMRATLPYMMPESCPLRREEITVKLDK